MLWRHTVDIDDSSGNLTDQIGH